MENPGGRSMRLLVFLSFPGWLKYGIIRILV